MTGVTIPSYSYSLKYKLFMIKIQNNRAKCFFFIEFSVYMGVRFILQNSLKGHKQKKIRKRQFNLSETRYSKADKVNWQNL